MAKEYSVSLKKRPAIYDVIVYSFPEQFWTKLGDAIGIEIDCDTMFTLVFCVAPADDFATTISANAGVTEYYILHPTSALELGAETIGTGKQSFIHIDSITELDADAGCTLLYLINGGSDMQIDATVSHLKLLAYGAPEGTFGTILSADASTTKYCILRLTPTLELEAEVMGTEKQSFVHTDSATEIDTSAGYTLLYPISGESNDMQIDTSASFSLARYRLLSDMEDTAASDYYDMTLEDVFFITVD